MEGGGWGGERRVASFPGSPAREPGKEGGGSREERG